MQKPHDIRDPACILHPFWHLSIAWCCLLGWWGNDVISWTDGDSGGALRGLNDQLKVSIHDSCGIGLTTEAEKVGKEVLGVWVDWDIEACERRQQARWRIVSAEWSRSLVYVEQEGVLEKVQIRCQQPRFSGWGSIPVPKGLWCGEWNMDECVAEWCERSAYIANMCKAVNWSKREQTIEGVEFHSIISLSLNQPEHTRGKAEKCSFGDTCCDVYAKLSCERGRYWCWQEETRRLKKVQWTQAWTRLAQWTVDIIEEDQLREVWLSVRMHELKCIWTWSSRAAIA